jgi:hypothetical protein
MLKSKGRIAAAGTAIAVATSAAAVLLLGGGSATAGTTAVSPANTVTGASVVDGSLNQVDINPNVIAKVFRVPGMNAVTSWSVKDGSIAEADLSQTVKTKLNAVGTGAAGKSAYEIAKATTGFKGTEAEWLASLKGKDGTDAVVSVTALSNLTNRPDSGLHGDWAIDTMARTVSITKQGAVPASNCGTGQTKCYFYTGSMTDSGSFKTIAGAKSPLKGVDINGVLTGTMSGGAKLEFYASSDAPDVSLVQGNVDGPGGDLAETTTARWVAQFFPASVAVTDAKLNDWAWTYTASDCEVHSQSGTGNEGDIAGVNACK